MCVNARVKEWNVTGWATHIRTVNFIVSCTLWQYFPMFDMLKGTIADPAVSKSGYAAGKK